MTDSMLILDTAMDGGVTGPTANAIVFHVSDFDLYGKGGTPRRAEMRFTLGDSALAGTVSLSLETSPGGTTYTVLDTIDIDTTGKVAGDAFYIRIPKIHEKYIRGASTLGTFTGEFYVDIIAG